MQHQIVKPHYSAVLASSSATSNLLLTAIRSLLSHLIAEANTPADAMNWQISCQDAFDSITVASRCFCGSKETFVTMHHLEFVMSEEFASYMRSQFDKQPQGHLGIKSHEIMPCSSYLPICLQACHTSPRTRSRLQIADFAAYLFEGI